LLYHKVTRLIRRLLSQLKNCSRNFSGSKRTLYCFWCKWFLCFADWHNHSWIYESHMVTESHVMPMHALALLIVACKQPRTMVQTFKEMIIIYIKMIEWWISSQIHVLVTESRVMPMQHGRCWLLLAMLTCKQPRTMVQTFKEIY
jgi:hypothetical protein